MQPTPRHRLVLAVLLLQPPLAAVAQAPASPLRTLVQEALARHPALRAAEARHASAGFAVAETRGALLPQARLDATATQFQEPMVVAPLHGFNPQRPPLFDRTLLQLQASVSMTLFDGGARRARVRQAEAAAAQGSAREDATRAHVVAEVTRAWLGVATGRALVEAESRRVEALASEQARISQLLEVGRAAPLDALRIRAALDRAVADQILAAATLAAGEEILARLVGRSPDDVRAMVVPASRAVGALPDEAAVRAAVREESPDVAEAAQQVSLADARDAEAGSARWPELRVQAGYADYSSGQGRLTGEWQAGLRAGYPIYTGGSRRAAIQRTAVDRGAARMALEAQLLRLDDAVSRELSAARGAAARAAALATAVTQQAEVERIERLALDAGAGTTRDWIAAQAELVAARSALVQAWHAEILARLELARLAGALTVEVLSTMLEPAP